VKVPHGAWARPGKGRAQAPISQETRTGNSTSAIISAPAAGSRLAGPALAAGNRPRAARYRRRHRAVWASLAGALAAPGAALVVIGALAQEHPPAPLRDLGTIPAPGSLTPATTSPGQAGREQAGAAWAGAVRGSPGLPPPPAAAASSTGALPWSRPVSLAIPAIGVHANVIDLGLGPGHTLQVPPLTQAGVQEAGWYDLGPAPGQLGPAVIAGHVDSHQGPGVFFRLGALVPGNQVDVTRADGTLAIFRVDAVDEYSKDRFPAQQVYGPVSYAGLRVITCGGSFDYQTRHYLSNIVVYATLTGSQAKRNG
jgi:hypothetical protein